MVTVDGTHTKCLVDHFNGVRDPPWDSKSWHFKRRLITQIESFEQQQIRAGTFYTQDLRKTAGFLAWLPPPSKVQEPAHRCSGNELRITKFSPIGKRIFGLIVGNLPLSTMSAATKRKYVAQEFLQGMVLPDDVKQHEIVQVRFSARSAAFAVLIHVALYIRL